MTGYTVHTGTSEKFSEGWDRIFSGSKQKKNKAATGDSTGRKPAPKPRKSKKK